MTKTHKQRTEIMIETWKVTTIRTSVRYGDLIECGHCKIRVSTISAKAAPMVFETSADELADLIQTDSIHFAVDSHLCCGSLARYFADRRQKPDPDLLPAGLVRNEPEPIPSN